MNKKVTSPKVASIAGKTLSNPRAPKLHQSLAGAALRQARPGAQTGAAMEGKASAVLKTKSAPAVAKKLAGTLVSQSNKSRGKG